MIKDILVEVVRQTSGLVSAIKITGTPTETRFQGVDENKTIFVEGVLKTPIPDFEGEFGITNLNLLKGLLEFASYRTDTAVFNVNRRKWNDKSTVESFSFRDVNNVGSDYRCMSPDLVPEQAEIRNIPWDVVFTPNKGKLAEFQQLSNLYKEVSSTFGAKTEETNLIFYIGDDNSSTHRGAMVFETGVNGNLGGDLLWSVGHFISVMKLAADKPTELRLTNHGVLSVSTETANANFTYFLRASRS